MTEKKYRLVPENDLIDILKAAHSFWALQQGGVDNWEWYGASMMDYVDNVISDEGLEADTDWDFIDIAKKDLYNYEYYK